MKLSKFLNGINEKADVEDVLKGFVVPHSCRSCEYYILKAVMWNKKCNVGQKVIAKVGEAKYKSYISTPLQQKTKNDCPLYEKREGSGVKVYRGND